MPAPAASRPGSPPSPWLRRPSPGPTSTPPPRTPTGRTPPAGSRPGRAAPAWSSGPTARPPPFSPSFPEPSTDTRPNGHTLMNHDTTDTDTLAPTATRLRASDTDRQQTVHLLQDAAARGLLTQDEAGERMAAAYAAQHLDELPPLTADLPPVAPPAPTAPGWGGPGGGGPPPPPPSFWPGCPRSPPPCRPWLRLPRPRPAGVRSSRSCCS